MASIACATSSHHPETHPSDDDRARHGSVGTGPDLLPTLELPGKQHSRLVDPAQSGHESWVCERAGRQLGTRQTSGGVVGASTASPTPGPNYPCTLDQPPRPDSSTP